MKKHVKALALSLCCLMGLATVACSNPTPTGPVGPTGPKDGSIYTKDAVIYDVDAIEMITGDALDRTIDDNGNKFRYMSRNYLKFKDDDLAGTDNGHMFYSEKYQKMFLLFGDTYTSNRSGESESGEDYTLREWLSNFMAITTDMDLNDGLEFDDVHRDANGKAAAIIEGKHFEVSDCVANGLERTKINQGGIEVPKGYAGYGTLYSFYESVRNFGTGGTWRVNYQGAIKSTDGGVTWERVHDLTWFDTATNKFKYCLYSAAEEVSQATDISITSESQITDQMIAEAREKIPNAEQRVNPYFDQCYPLDGKDGYMYLFGRASGRQHGIKVARVTWDNIEKFEEYEYYCGNEGATSAKPYGDMSKPIWKKGYEGLKAINNHEVGYVFAHGQDEVTSSFSAMYNEYLGKWMIVYYQPPNFASGNNVFMSPQKVGFRLSDVPWGNYGKFHTIMEQDFFAPEGVNTGDGDILEFKGYDFDEKGFAQNENDIASSFKSNKAIKLYGGFVHEKYQEENGKIFYIIITLDGIYNSALFRVTLN
ncbi:MAG: DUF4185 domain-containing protein [Clostridiales bacterium]|nr:DUF4185 domain-containing protein [Clostridiales bacterium]